MTETKDKPTPPTPTPHEDRTLEAITANFNIVREQAKELEDDLRTLEERIRLARGTGDVSRQAEVAQQAAVVEPKKPAPAPTPPTPREQVRSALRGQSVNVATVVKLTGMTLSKVQELIRLLKVEREVINVGSEDFPLWTLRVGDAGSTGELISEVKRLIMERPMTMQELVEVTGARMSRVSGAVVHLQRTETQLMNLGTQRRARWFLVAPGVQFAKLPPNRG